MKKAILFVLTVISVLFLISCSKSDVMISGEWWTPLPDEAGSGSEDLVIQFNSAKSTVNFALKSLDNKSDKNYYIVESLVRKYTVENTGKGEGILRITDKKRQSVAGAPYQFAHSGAVQFARRAPPLSGWAAMTCHNTFRQCFVPQTHYEMQINRDFTLSRFYIEPILR